MPGRSTIFGHFRGVSTGDNQMKVAIEGAERFWLSWHGHWTVLAPGWWKLAAFVFPPYAWCSFIGKPLEAVHKRIDFIMKVSG